MTMIRINLIAEKKAGAPKAAKKPSAQQSEIREKMILILLVLLAFGVYMVMRYQVKSELDHVRQRNKKLKADYDRVKIWQDKKQEYEIQKELLNEKIRKISELKDRREGPVKLMEDVANALPESVWLGSLTQGYNAQLTKTTGKNRVAYKPSGKNIGDPALVKVSGYAKTSDSVTNFAAKVLNLDTRYEKIDLNNVRLSGNQSKEFEFELFFKVKPKVPERSTVGDEGGGSL